MDALAVMKHTSMLALQVRLRCLQLQRSAELYAESRKLGGRHVGAATTAASPPGRLGLLVDSSSRTQFLIDTGSVYSLLPHSSTSPASSPALVLADKSLVKCWGARSVQVRVQNRIFHWNFLLAAVAFPIISGDFLQHYDLKVDLKRLRLEHGSHGWSVSLAAPPTGSSFAAIGVHPAGADRGLSTPLPPFTAQSIPRQILPNSHLSTAGPPHAKSGQGAGEYPSPSGSPPSQYKSPRSCQPTVDKEEDYPSTAESSGRDKYVATPTPTPRATMPATSGTGRWTAWTLFILNNFTCGADGPNRAYVLRPPRF